MVKLKFSYLYNEKEWNWEKEFHGENIEINKVISDYLDYKEQHLPVSKDKVKWKQIN